MSRDAENPTNEEPLAPPGVMPSLFMRQLRPEYYSDSQDRTRIHLTSDRFDYHLETITSRNQTNDFELFCRKLCERAICPDLRAKTGPDGGGDSKVDTETQPVAEEITERYFEGLRKEANETWAFAISAQKDWKTKARQDVESIASTGRAYDRIFFITNQLARDKDRAKLESDLATAHGVPVTIHDRSWIIDETVSKERTDLAYNFLHVGDAVSGARLGPNDYSRSQQLEDIERELGNPDNFAGMEMQLVSEALAAAKLSRGLEKPRHETDGRFQRAVRLAEKYGTLRQKLEVQYESIWTAFWWFDDFDGLITAYTAFEEQALKSDNAIDLELLGNLHQLLVNTAIHKHVSEEKTEVWERADRLEARLTDLAKDGSRPNNSLSARADLLRVQLNRALLKNEPERLPAIWNEYGEIVDAAGGLGEFNFDTLLKFVDVVGQVAGNDPAYNALVEKCAAAVGQRKSESEAALMYLRRAEKLGFEDNFDMIRWLSRAVVGLSKQEYADEQLEAAYRLAVAYRSAGLLWAARASCGLAMATAIIEADRNGEVPIETVAATKLWTWLSLELWHLPDTLHGIQLLNALLSSLPLADESKERVRQDLLELDLALGSLLLDVEAPELDELATLPDLLGGLGLHTSRAALLYSMGHLETLRAEGAIPATETDASFEALMEKLWSEGVAERINAPLVLNSGDAQTLSSTILGMNVTVAFDDTSLIPVAEAVLGTLEVFFATAIEQIAPHTENYRIALSVDASAEAPHISTNPQDMQTNISWPRGVEVGNYEKARIVREGLMTLAGHVLGTACSMRESDLLERLFRDDAVAHRVEIVAAFSNSYTRFNNRPFAQLADWDKHHPRRFEIKEPRPTMASTSSRPAHGEDEPKTAAERVAPTNHKHLGVKSVIDLPTWDAAVWRGCGYLQMGHDLPPLMALLFENGEAGRKIFARWHDRFGDKDLNEEIAISIIRDLPGQNPHHYLVQITSSVSADERPDVMLTVPMRSHEMMPNNSENLERFLGAYRRFGVYAIMPGVLPDTPGAQPEFDFDLAIEKRALSVRQAESITRSEPEFVALAIRGLGRET